MLLSSFRAYKATVEHTSGPPQKALPQQVETGASLHLSQVWLSQHEPAAVHSSHVMSSQLAPPQARSPRIASIMFSSAILIGQVLIVETDEGGCGSVWA